MVVAFSHPSVTPWAVKIRTLTKVLPYWSPHFGDAASVLGTSKTQWELVGRTSEATRPSPRDCRNPFLYDSPGLSAFLFLQTGTTHLCHFRRLLSSDRSPFYLSEICLFKILSTDPNFVLLSYKDTFLMYGPMTGLLFLTQLDFHIGSSFWMLSKLYTQTGFLFFFFFFFFFGDIGSWAQGHVQGTLPL
jgi:hypothetical protein